LFHEPQLKSWTVESKQSFFNFTLKSGTPKMAIFSNQIRNKKIDLDISHISAIYYICLEDIIERTLPKHMSLLEKKTCDGNVHEISLIISSFVTEVSHNTNCCKRNRFDEHHVEF